MTYLELSTGQIQGTLHGAFNKLTKIELINTLKVISGSSGAMHLTTSGTTRSDMTSGTSITINGQDMHITYCRGSSVYITVIRSDELEPLNNYISCLMSHD